MPLEIRWLASMSASSLHACEAFLSGKITNGSAALNEPCRQLTNFVQSDPLLQRQLFTHLIALTADIDSNAELANLALRKTLGAGNAARHQTARLAEILTDLERATCEMHPGGVDQLALRAGPLKEQWEARGPGLWSILARLIGSELLVERADVIFVHPTYGGGGAAHLPYNSVRIEAMLANPHPELPEVVRLAWLLSQLHLDLPRFCETIAPERRTLVAASAMLVPVLSAAAEVELARCNESTVEAALRVWQLGVAPDSTKTLFAWWQTTQNTQTAWKIALPALDQMLP